MNGITFLRTICGKRINIPFILFTGVGEELMHQAIENGANPFILKTSDPKTQNSELSKRILQIINSSADLNRVPGNLFLNFSIHMFLELTLLSFYCLMQVGRSYSGYQRTK
jgi:DNA-binding NarL/FixJ family response regulator